MYLGAVLGMLAGLSLRWMVRQEITKVSARTSATITRLAEAGQALPTARTLASTGLAAPGDVSPIAAPVDSPVDVPPAHSTTEVSASLANASLWADTPDELAGAPSEAQTATRPAKPVVPAQPNALEQALTAAKNWFLGGNTIVRVGLVILFIGLSFLARYAAASGLLPVEFRLAAIGVAGIALLVVGFGKREAKPGFALALQGGGVAVLYLTVFAAFRLYGLVPALPAFVLMTVVCGLSCVLALMQNARSLAVAAFAGGFAVPVLLSTGQGSHVALFSYYTVLNLAILFIAYRRSWRVLNVLGFVATFVVAGTWGALKFLPDQYASAQPFLIGFLLIYIATAVLYARNTATRLGNAVDSTLVFGTPLVGFGLQAGLVQHLYLGTAFSALGFAAVYLLLATVLVRRSLDNYRLLIECFMALGVGFATLAVPLALDAQWTSAVWALEGAGAFWVGMRQARWMPRAFGLLLQAVAALAFFGGNTLAVSALPLLNPAFMGALLIALPALMLAWWLHQPLAHSGSTWGKGYAVFERQLAKPVYLYGFAFWCLAFVLEIHRAAPGLITLAPQGMEPVGVIDVFNAHTQQLLTLLALVGSAALSLWLGLRKQWAVATWPSRFTVVAMALSLLVQLADEHRVLNWPAWLIWPVVLLLHYGLLRQNDRAPSIWQQKFNHWVHAGSVWLLAMLLADALWFAIGKGDLWRTSWASVVLLFSAIVVLIGLVLWAGRANRADAAATFKWPLQSHASAYYWTAAVPLAALVFVGALALAWLSKGSTEPLPYIPLLNPTELAIALGMGALMFWRRMVREAQPQPQAPQTLSPGAQWLQGPQAVVALAALGFVVLNTVWLRIAHHFFGVDWSAPALFNSFVVQTGYAILWSLLALALMVVAHRRLLRTLWLAGAGLLGLVVVKLVLIDLANAGGVERIVAFIAVGVLMLVVGYFAPMPPKAAVPAAPEAFAAPESPEIRENT